MSKLDKINDLTKRVKQIESNYEIVKKAHNSQTMKANMMSSKVNKDHQIVSVLLGAVVKHEKQIRSLKERIVNTKAEAMKCNIVISSIIEKAEEDCVNRAKAFFQDCLKITGVKIVKAFRIGVGTNRPMVVMLTDPSEKKNIFQNSQMLKDMKNERGKPYNDKMPEEMYALRKLFREHMKENRKLPVVNRAKMTFKKGKPMLEDKPWKPEIDTPTTEDFANITDLDRTLMDGLVMYESAIQIEGFSKFTGYACTVNT